MIRLKQQESRTVSVSDMTLESRNVSVCDMTGERRD